MNRMHTKGNPKRLSADFSATALRSRREGHDIFAVRRQHCLMALIGQEVHVLATPAFMRKNIP